MSTAAQTEQLKLLAQCTKRILDKIEITLNGSFSDWNQWYRKYLFEILPDIAELMVQDN